MDPNDPKWIYAQFVKWAKDNGGPLSIYRIVQGRNVMIPLLVIETFVLLGIGAYEFFRSRMQIDELCKQKLSEINVTPENIEELKKIIGYWKPK